MLASVFSNKRNKTNKQQRKFSATIPGLRRVHSPPSPASFASPEIVEIHEKGPFGAVVPAARAPPSSIDRTVTPPQNLSSPQLQLNFSPGESLSEWLPSNIHPVSETRTPPKRNVSLPNGSRSPPDPAASSRARGALEESIKEELEPLEPQRLFVETSAQSAQRSSEYIAESSALPYTRKPTPSPIKIPNNATSSKIKIQRSFINEVTDTSRGSTPPLLHSKNPPSPSSAVTEDVASAISGTSAFVVNSFILSNESRTSKYKSGGPTRQDSATLPRGEHPLNHSPYLRERQPSLGSLGSAPSPSVPPVPPLPSDIGSADTSGLRKRNSISLVLESGDRVDSPPRLRRPTSTGRLREQTISMPPISPISETSSPVPSMPTTPIFFVQGASQPSNNSNASSRSLAISVAAQRTMNLDGNTSSSSLGTGEGSSHVRAATEPTERRPSVSSSKEQPRKNSNAMPGTMRSSGALTVTNGRLAITRAVSETGGPRPPGSQPSRPAVLLPIGERPASVATFSPQPSAMLPTCPPISARSGPVQQQSETPVDSPDLLDNFPVQISRERSNGPPPPLPLGRRSEDNGAISSPMDSSSGESMPSTTDRQTFPETPNAFSPMWSAGFASPSGNTGRSSFDKNMGRGTSSSRVLDIRRMSARGPRIQGSAYSKLSIARSSRVPPTPPLTGESTSSQSQSDSPRTSQMEWPASPPTVAMKRLTAIEEQVASRSVSQYSTLPEPPTSGSQWANGTFAGQQSQPLPLAVPERTRERSESVSGDSHPRSRSGSVANSVTNSQAPSQTQTGPTSNTSGSQGKAAEATSHRRMRSVTNPDEPLGSPPPSYMRTFDLQPPPTPLILPRAGTTESSEASRRSSSQSSPHLQATPPPSQISVPQKRSLSPFPSPPNSSIPSSPGRSRADAHASSISVEHPPPPYVDEHGTSTPPVPQIPISSIPPPPLLAPAPSERSVTSPPHTPSQSAFGPPDTTPSRRFTRSRPSQVPHGPRKPSYSAATARARAESVSSLSNVGPSSNNSRIMTMMSQAAPRFQMSRVPFRGLTMEAAQWTLTSQQLQHIVSTAIRQSADASAIRILPLETLDGELPAEIERLEAHSAELKTKYKLAVRKRNALLAGMSRALEGGESSENAGRMLEELSDVTEALDQTAEELYVVTDQLSQLHHSRELHQRSALAMALRKLNTSFLKQVSEVQRLCEQVTTLEAERDEAWREAQEVAQEFDDFTDRIMPDATSPSDKLTPSRRSSRVSVARKTSQRASKAGLRSMYRRSQRSSTSSAHRYSGFGSPGSWGGLSGGEEIPPVPPIPIRRDIFLPLGDLPTRSSIDSPSSDLRAMFQAQKELCEMLGITLEDLKIQNHGPSRRQSMSAIPMKTPESGAPTRRNSDVVTPNYQRGFKV